MYQMIRARRFFRKSLRRMIPLVLLALAILAGLFLFHRNYLILEGHVYRRDITQLDLSGSPLRQTERITELTKLEQLDLLDTGLTAEEYELLQAALPQCRILWQPYFQGRFYPLDTQELTVTELTEEDVRYLDYFGELTHLDATGCKDYDAIMALVERRPDCRVDYRVPIGQTEYLPDATELTATSQDLQTLAQMLPYLPKANTVLVTLPPEAMEEYRAVKNQHPHICFDYQLDLYGLILPSNTVEADLSSLALSQAAEVELILPHLRGLTQVDIRGCIIPQEQITEMTRRWPGITFLWNVHLAGLEISSDVTTLDLSGVQFEDTAIIEGILPYFPNLTKVILTDCGLSNEELDALNRKYEDIQIVWEVQLGPFLRVRTDVTALIPTRSNAWLTDEQTYNLRYCTELVALDLGHLDISQIEFVAYMPKLKYLIVADSQVASLEPLRGLPELIYLEAFLTHVTDYSPLADCPALEDVNISWTYGNYEPLCRIPNLKRLWWGGTGHSTESVYLLKKHHPDATLVLYDGESTGSGWRKHPHYYEMRDLLGMFYMD